MCHCVNNRQHNSRLAHDCTTFVTFYILGRHKICCRVCRNGAGPAPNLISTSTMGEESYSVTLGSYAATSQITIL